MNLNKFSEAFFSHEKLDEYIYIVVLKMCIINDSFDAKIIKT